MQSEWGANIYIRMCFRSLTWLTLTVTLLPAMLPATESFSGKCDGITDGDTVRVFHLGRDIEVRLDGIDCPQEGQDGAGEAGCLISDLSFGREVYIRAKELDKYVRSVARVTVDGRGPSVELVKAGLA